MVNKDILLRRACKYAFIGIMAPMLLALIGAYFSRFVVEAKYNKDLAIYRSAVMKNTLRYKFIKEDLQELKDDVKLLLKNGLVISNQTERGQ